MRVNDFYGNKFKWFTGVIKQAEGGKVRVRCFGIHPFEPDGSDSGPATIAVSNGDLPYATLIYPINSTSPEHLLNVQDWVYGFFADGDSCQQPVIVGKLAKADGSGSTTFLGGDGGAEDSGQVGDGNTGGDSPAPDGEVNNGALPTHLSASSVGPKDLNSNTNYYGNIPGESNVEKVFNYLGTFFINDLGFTEQQAKKVAVGVMVSLAGESGWSLSPDPKGSNDKGMAHGLAQWYDPNRGRLAALDQMCKRGDLDCQLNFLGSELKNLNFGHKAENTKSGLVEKLRNANSSAYVAYLWTKYYEIPANTESKAKERQGWLSGSSTSGNAGAAKKFLQFLDRPIDFATKGKP